MTTQVKMLTAQELVQLRVKVDKTLPTKGTKEFNPSHSWLENKQIQTALDERKALLEEERVEKLGSLAQAEWDPEKKVANVTLRVGRHWMQMGHEVSGNLILFPEEALFLLETNSLELTYNGVAMSVQQAYCTLLGPSTGCSVNEYLTYLHLVRQGYILLRHSKSIRATRYERQIRLDQHTVGQKQRRSKEDATVQDIVIDDGNTEVKSHSQNINCAIRNNNVVKLEESQAADIKPSDVCKEIVPDSVNNFGRTNKDSEVNRKQSLQFGERSNINGSVTDEQSNLIAETSKNHSANQTGVPNEDSKLQVSSKCNEVDKSMSPNILQNEVGKRENTVVDNGTDTSLKVLHNEHNESDSIDNTGSAADVAVDIGNSEKNESHNNKPSSSKEDTDVIIVDDSSTSMDTNEKSMSVTESKEVVQSDTPVESSVLKTEKPSMHGADVVDISDSSQTSQPESFQNIAIKGHLSKTGDEIEIVSLIDDKKDIDDIVEVKFNDMSKKSHFSSRCKQSENKILASASKHQTSSEKNVFRVKGEENDDDTKSITKNRGKITNVQLKHDEVKIMPNIIDLSEDEEKPDVKEEIEIVDLDDDDRPFISWEQERRAILDSIPSIEGKYVIHVKVPDSSLLPPNVCPQKEDYYVHRWNVREAGLGGRPSMDASNSRENFLQNNSGETEETLSPWSPWVQFSPSQVQGGGNMFGAAGMWNNNAFPFFNPLMNPQFQPFFGALAMQGMFPRVPAMFQNFGGPSWRSNISSPFTPHRFRNPYVPRTWHYRRRPYYRRPYYKRRRYDTHYNSAPVGLGEQNFGSNSNNHNEVIPLKVEDVKTTVKVQAVDDDDNDDDVEVDNNCYENNRSDDDDDDGDDDENDYVEDEEDEEDNDVIECTSDSSPIIKEENDIIECTENGIAKSNLGRACKRKGSQSQRVFEPPNKLQCIIDRLKVELKHSKKQTVFQENKGQENCTDARTWKDVKQIVVLDTSSEEEESEEDEEEEDDDIFVIGGDIPKAGGKKNEPLVQPEDCRDIDSILSKLQIIKSANFENIKETAADNNLKICFDLYLPNPAFRKTSPGLPNYRITVFGYEEPIPERRDIVALLKDFQDDVPLLFAVVLPDTVTFLQCGSIDLPVESFCP